MTDFNEPKPSATATVDPPRPRGEEPDPLAHLHKMSTTAGITSQEYVAINIPSIVALVLGLASVVAVLSWVLLVIPLAAVVTAIVALRQIRDSNGTQTGRAFAWLGIAVSLGIGSYKVVATVTEQLQTRADRQAIAAELSELGRLVHETKYDEAYKLFSSRFQDRVPLQTFTEKWTQLNSFPNLGKVRSIEWNKTTILFQSDPSSGARVAFATAWLHFEKDESPGRYTFDFRKSGPNWEIDGVQLLFPTEQQPARRRRPQQ